MRNFKKFLALVLAMLMVSACAVSVSAAYADQADIDASGYADAVAALTDLGVVKGNGESFGPNGTLTRAEAAVIAAKLVAGAKGQSFDWTSATCQFADVDAAWAYAYINYVGQRGIMAGSGDGKFNPNGTLQIDEAIAIAVKAASAEWTATATLNTTTYKPAYWGMYWIAIAEEKGLLNNVDAFDYTAPCSKAMFAQIAYNALQASASIKNGFGLEPVVATILSVTDVVTLSTNEAVGHVGEIIPTINVDAFNAALAAAGYDVTAADLKGSKINMTWSTKTYAIYGIEVDTSVAVATYADGAIANVKKDNANVPGKINISGVEYIVGVKDSTAGPSIIGGTSSSVRGLELTINGTTVAKDADVVIPTYYKAFGFDDDKDGDYERVVINEYVIATVKLEKTTKQGAIDIYSVKSINSVNGTIVNAETGTDGKDTTPVIWTGAALVADNETPMLVAKDITTKDDAGKNFVIDVLEVAATVTGKVQGLSKSGKYLTLTDGNKYTYKLTGAADPDSAILQQTVSFFTIGGEYVKLADAAFDELTIIVDDVTVNADGKAVVKGYNYSTYAPVEITVEGAAHAGKYVALKGFEAENKVADKVYAGLVTLGLKDANNAWTINKVEFVNGGVYKFTLNTADSNYYYENYVGTITDGTKAFPTGKLEVKGAYVYLDGIATYYTKDVTVFSYVAPKAGDYNAYAATYSVGSSFPAMNNVSAVYKTVTDNNIEKVNFVYVTGGVNIPVTMKAIPEGQTIVQVLGDYIEAGYDYFVYEVVDLFAGTKTTVKSSVELAPKGYYTAADGVAVEYTTNNWMKDKTIEVSFKGLIPTYKAAITVAVKDGDKVEYNHSDIKEFGLDMMTVYVDADADGIIDIKDGAPVTKAASEVVTETLVAKAYVIEGKIILVK